MARANEMWPRLDYVRMRPTLETLQLWTQMVGKVRVAQTPWINHGWQSTLYVSARGLTTGLIPHGDMGFELTFDLIAHRLIVLVSDGGEAEIALRPGSVAEFYNELTAVLSRLGVPVAIDVHPNELAEAVPFPQDMAMRAYDAEAARRFFQALVQCARVFKRFRSRFIGKCSPVHFFWGSFDLAVTRFSGRPAPLHPGGVLHLPDAVAREAYSHEVSSAGFWPGSAALPEAAFYSYCYPAPAGFAEAPVLPVQARYDTGLGEFLLPYEAVRTAADPDATLLAFLQTTYEAAANAGAWARAALEVPEGIPGRPRRLG